MDHNTLFFRGHPCIMIYDKLCYEDTLDPLPGYGGEIRPCKRCGKEFSLGEGVVDPCLGMLPGVDNACCGHGVPEEAYVRFTTGVVLKNFSVEYTEQFAPDKPLKVLFQLLKAKRQIDHMIEKQRKEIEKMPLSEFQTLFPEYERN